MTDRKPGKKNAGLNTPTQAHFTQQKKKEFQFFAREEESFNDKLNSFHKIFFGKNATGGIEET